MPRSTCRRAVVSLAVYDARAPVADAHVNTLRPAECWQRGLDVHRPPRALFARFHSRADASCAGGLP
jgi:hypothetical protein